MTSTQSKGVLCFLTEQAYCLAQAGGRETEDFLACRETALYLANGDAEAIAAFDERTGAVARDWSGDEDYDTEDYAGKRNDVRAAVAELENRGRDTATPEAMRGTLMKTADLIADFYGLDLDEEMAG
jgi:hypothetical protein